MKEKKANGREGQRELWKIMGFQVTPATAHISKEKRSPGLDFGCE